METRVKDFSKMSDKAFFDYVNEVWLDCMYESFSHIYKVDDAGFWADFREYYGEDSDWVVERYSVGEENGGYLLFDVNCTSLYFFSTKEEFFKYVISEEELRYAIEENLRG